MAGNKYLINSPTFPGLAQEVVAAQVSAGVGDAGKIIALNTNGVLDPTVVNSIVTSLGAGSSGKVVALTSTGQLDMSVMPTGIGADTAAIAATEALAPGAFVNIWESTGAKVRNADATVAGKEAHGFVLAGVASLGMATVYFEGNNNAVTGQTAGVVYLTTTAGTGGAAAPSGSGNVVQRIGFASSPTSVNFQSENPIILA